MSKLKDLTSQKFGYLTPLYIDRNPKYKRIHWVCKCDCGNITIVPTCDLTSGHTKSCGCFKFASRNKKHGMKHTRIYNIWCGMNKRCYIPTEKCYKYYGAKGITVCDEWQKDFISFYKWAMSNGYTEELTLDRIDNSKNYCPENCKWSTLSQQQRNKTNNIYMEYNGQIKLMIEWCEILNFPYKLAKSRRSRYKNKGQEPTFEQIFKGAF